MTNPLIRELAEAEWALAFPLIGQLRPQLAFDTFLQRCQAARTSDGYALYGAFAEGGLVGVIGVRTLVDLLHGPHIYIDDLVVEETVRSQGIGGRLLAFAEAMARDAGGLGLRVSTGINYEPAKRFYAREGWVAAAVTFKKHFSSL